MHPNTTAAMFVWSDKYETGIEKIDRQHRRLVEMVNRLAAMQADHADPEALLQLFGELADYTVFHFETEEALMEQHPVDPEFHKTHLKAHATFVRQVSDARAAARDNPAEVIGRLLGFLCRWLISHILGSDMRLAREVKAIRAGLPEEEARAKAAAHMVDTNELLLEAMDVLYGNLADRTHDFWQTNHRLHEEIEEHQRTMGELRKLSRAVECSPVQVMITDIDGRIEYVNDKFCQANGYEAAELVGKTPQVLKSGQMPESLYAELWATVSRGEEWFGEMQNLRKDESLYWARVSISPLTDLEGRITHFISFSEDITASKEAEAAVRNANTKLAASNAELVRQARDLTLLNRMNEMLQVCLSAEEAYGVIADMASELELGLGGAFSVAAGERRCSEVVARWGESGCIEKLFDFDRCCAIRLGQRHDALPDSKGLHCPHFSTSPEHGYLCIPLQMGGEVMGALHLLLPDSESRGQHMRLVQLSTTVAEAIKLSLSNIRLRETLHDQAIHDPLTGLYNRCFLDESLLRELHRASREGESLSLLMIDIDHFKRVNDRHGHKAGDEVLVALADSVRRAMRLSDIACRFGGEEFVLVMPDADQQEAAERMAKLADAIRQLRFGPSAFQVTVSVGIATYPQHGGSAAELISCADQALYRAKALGRDRICIDSEGE